MGFLDHSTNNIILDAVLTDEGRRALAKNDGSFKIYQFSLSDDEVNYNIIKKYGRSVGKEKIEKNTPIFEALTSQEMSLKHKLISLPDPEIDYLPKLNLGSPNTLPLSFKRQNTTSINVTIVQNFGSNTQISFDESYNRLIDSLFHVELNSNFFTIQGNQPDLIYSSGIARYSLSSSSTSAGNVSFTLLLRGLSDNTFSIFGDSNQLITTMIKVIGFSSGYVFDIPATISKV